MEHYATPSLWRRGLMLMAMMCFGLALSAQSGGYEQIDWDDDDDEDEDSVEVVTVARPKVDEATVYLDGEEVPISDDFIVYRHDTLQVQIRDLMPSTYVAVHLKKGGATLEKMGWFCNERGELDLEIRTGKKKVKGSAVLFYTPSNGRKKKREVKVQVTDPD